MESRGILSLSNEILARIFSFIPNDGSKSRLAVISTCKHWCEVYTNIVLPPWEIFYLESGASYCGLMGAFDVNDDTVNLLYFYKWYEIARDRFDLYEYGGYLLELSASLIDADHRRSLIKFLLAERQRRNEPFNISKAVETILYREDVEDAYIIFIDYCSIAIDVKVLKKWCTILIYKREFPSTRIQEENRIKLIAWIKNRPEMTKYRINGQDRFNY